MRKFNTLFVLVLAIFSFQLCQAQLCTSDRKGPNLLGAKGTFSHPYITPNAQADACLAAGNTSFNPVGNIGNPLADCGTNTGDIIPCSDYKYTAKQNGMSPEFTYTLMKVMGDANGHNCIHPSTNWVAQDHTNDNGYFMAVNGAPNEGFSKIFYQIKRIPVCPNTTYEFSAWVINMMPPGGAANAAPNVSFVVNGDVIGNSGPIAYDRQWHQVGGSYTPPEGTFFVDLQVINATTVAGGNDLGLDDISFRVCQSQIAVGGAAIVVEGTSPSPQFTVDDPAKMNTWYKWDYSVDGGSTWISLSNGETATFDANGKYVVSPAEFLEEVDIRMHGNIYRLSVSTSKAGLNTPACVYVNQYVLNVREGSAMPVQLTSFDGTYAKGIASLKWQTSQEVNSDRFELYRSFDGSSFDLAGTVAGAGNSSSVQNYQYQDKIDATGEYIYYKLKQIDKDGKFSFSNVVKLAVSESSLGFRLYPNPVVNSFTAAFRAETATKATLVIRNMTGQTIFSKKVDVLKGNNSVFVSNAVLNKGTYHVTITGENISFSGKLQKQ